MRIRGSDVLNLLAGGLTAEQVVEELPDLERDDVAACLRFASRRVGHPVFAAYSVRVWIDAQLTPALAQWLRDDVGVEAVAVRDLGLRSAEDPAVFAGARTEGAVVLTKDSDFVDLVG